MSILSHFNEYGVHVIMCLGLAWLCVGLKHVCLGFRHKQYGPMYGCLGQNPCGAKFKHSCLGHRHEMVDIRMLLVMLR